jgi:hypothetical protein
LDIETLKLQRESLASDVTSLKADINSLLSQVTTATASAALLGVFGALRPTNESTLISVLFAIALLPFVVIVFTALTIPDPSRYIEKALNPLKKTFAELAKDQQERETKAPWTQVLSIATYEQMRRREAAISVGVVVPLPGHAQRSLAEVDRVAGAPVRNARLESRRVSRGAVLRLEPKKKCHPASLRFGGAGRRSTRITPYEGLTKRSPRAARRKP